MNERKKIFELSKWRGWLLIPLLFILLFVMKNWISHSMTYPAPPVQVKTPPPGMEEIKLELASQAEVYGWLYRAPDNRNMLPVILFFHGNGENLETLRLSGILDDFRRLGVHFLAMDYPGYGKCGGSASEESLLETGQTAFHWLKDEFPGNPNIICGWSLGAAVAIQTAARNSDAIAGLIALSAWSSLADVGAVHYPGWLVKIMLSENYNSRQAAEKIECPTLIIHGESDWIIPLEQGKAVADALKGSTRWVPIPGRGHNDLLSDPMVWKEMKTFVDNIRVRE